MQQRHDRAFTLRMAARSQHRDPPAIATRLDSWSSARADRLRPARRIRRSPRAANAPMSERPSSVFSCLNSSLSATKVARSKRTPTVCLSVSMASSVRGVVGVALVDAKHVVAVVGLRAVPRPGDLRVAAPVVEAPRRPCVSPSGLRTGTPGARPCTPGARRRCTPAWSDCGRGCCGPGGSRPRGR